MASPTNIDQSCSDPHTAGVPLRLEVGPRDLTNKQCRIVRRDNGEKSDVALAGLEDTISALLDEIQASLLAK